MKRVKLNILSIAADKGTLKMLTPQESPAESVLYRTERHARL